MSERSSFVTEYIYCSKCFEAAKRHLLDNRKYLCSITIPSWSKHGEELPIIAGNIGGGYAGEEFHDMEFELLKDLKPELCCNLRVTVISEGAGVKTFLIRKTDVLDCDMTSEFTVI